MSKRAKSYIKLYLHLVTWDFVILLRDRGGGCQEVKLTFLRPDRRWVSLPYCLREESEKVSVSILVF